MTITANDGAGGITSTTFALTVNNVAPTATFNASSPVNEGSSISLSLTAGADASSVDATSLTYAFDCGLGAGYGAATSTATASCPTTDNGSRTVKGKVLDKDGASTEYSASVTINNVAPTATFNAPASVNEGSNISLSLTGPTDPSSADTTAGFQYAFDCGTGSGFSLFSAASTAVCATNDNGTRTVKGQIRDKDLAITEYSKSVTVNNVAPTATFSAPSPVNEGSPIALSLTSATDASSVDATSLTYAFDCGLGAGYGAATSTATASCPTTDNGSRTVKAKVLDKDGASTEYSASVTINNVAPTATFAATSPVNEGSSIGLSFSGTADVSSADQSAGFTYAFDCGSGYGSFSGVSTASCSTNDNGSRTVKGKVQDKDGGTTEYSASVTISNVAPTATFNAPVSVNEGSNIALSLSSPVDASSIDAGILTYAFDCGSGYGAFSSTASASCPTTDEGTRTVKGKIRDKDGGETEYTASVTINNVAPLVTAPVVNAPQNQGASEGVSHTFTLGSFTDPGADSPWSISVDWGDGNTDSLTAATATGPLGTGAHTYVDNGTFTVTITVTDVDGASGSNTFTVSVANTAPTALMAGDSVNEGSPATVSLAFASDPSSADTTAGFRYSFSCANDPLDLASTYAVATSSSSALCTYDDGPANNTVAGRIFDKDGGYTDYTTTVHVNNVAPSPAINGAPPASPEGTAIVLTASATDPSAADTAAGFEFSWTVTKDGDAYTSGVGSSFSFTPDDNGAYVVTLTATDQDGGSASTSASIAGTNVEPTATFTSPPSVSEGSPITLAFSDELDASSADQAAGFEYAFDCGTAGYGVFGPIATIDCPTSDDETRTVRGQIKDKDGGVTEYTATVNVANVAPSVDAGGDTSLAEGDTLSRSGSFSDPGADTWTATVDYGDGTPVGALTLNPDKSFSLSHTYADDGSYSVTVTVADDDASGSASFSVTVANVAPSVDLSGDPNVAEGSPYTLSISAVSDPGTDTVSSYLVAWGDGNSDTVSAADLATAGGQLAHTYADGPADHTISVTLTDEDGDFANATTLPVHVTNVAPTVSLNGAAAVDESDTPYAYSFLVSDPGDDGFTVSEADISCGTGGGLVAGSLTTLSSGGSFSCLFLDGPADPQLSITVTDDDLATGSTTLDVAVSNVKPFYTAPELGSLHNQDASEGAVQAFDLGAFTDAGTIDQDWTIDVDWGDGSTPESFTQALQGAIDLTTHTYADDGSYLVGVTVTDKDGGTDSGNFTISVANVAPSVDAGAGGSLNEGDTFTSAGSFSDPGADTWTATVDYGDGSPVSPLALNSDKTFTLSHLYAQDGSYTLTVVVTDDEGASGTATATVNVANVAPSVDAGGDTSLAEGDTLSRSGSFSDPGADTWTATVDYGDGTQVGALTLNPDKSFSLSHTYADDGSYSVTVTVADDDASGSASFSVTVANVAPSVDLSGDPNVAEGSPYTLSISAVSDPGTDTVSSYLVAWGDGNSDTVSAADLATAGGQLAHTYADGPADHTISVTLTDEDGDFANATTLPVHVTNVAPTVSLNGAAAVDESDTPYAYSFLVSDPGDDGFTVSEADISCGTGGSLVAGSLTTLSSGGSFSCLFLDGPADPQLSITVTDDDLATGSTTLDVAVSNVKPFYTAPELGSLHNQDASEGAVQAFDLGAFTDAGTIDQDWTIDVDWGDGSTPESFTQALQGAIDLTTHTYADDGSYLVGVTVTDKDGGTDSGNFTISVANVAPSVDAGAGGSLNEGDTFTSAGSFSDPGADTWTATVDYGDGSPVSPLALNSDKTFTLSHLYAQDGSYTLTVVVTDDEGASGTATATVNVANVAPSVDAGGDTSLAEGDTLSRSGSFSDPGADTWTATVDYGDGTPVGALTLNPDKSFSLSHTYADDGSYSVTVTVADDDASGSASFSVTVANVAPSVDLSGDPNVAEGSPYTLSISAVSDPGTDTVSSYLVAWGDGNSDTVSAADLATAGGQLAHTYADGPADHTISVTLTDEDGDFANATTLPVHVTNVAPTVSLNGAAAVDESDTPYAYSFLVSDPGDDGFTVSEADISCGTGGSLVAGSLTTLSSGGSFSCLFLDGPADPQLSITVTDDDLATGSTTLDVAVSNVKPFYTAPELGSLHNQDASEGAVQAFDLGAFTDAGTIDQDWTIDVDWGDGSTPESFTQALQGAIDLTTHTYADDGSYLVGVTVTDKDGGTDSGNFTISVANVAPSIAISGAPSVNEGSPYTLNLGTVSDPGTDTVTSYIVHWGDGSMASYAAGGAVTHTYADGPNTYAVSVDLLDEDGTHLDRANPLSVSVANVAPSIAISGAPSVNEGSPYTLNLGTVSDPGTDTVTSYIVHWGDGSMASYAAGGAVTHTYADGPNTYAVSVDLLDEDGTHLDRANPLSVSVANVAPSIAISGAPSVNEGSPYTLNLGTVSDPGTDTVTSYIVHWGDGSMASYAAGGAVTHTYADGPNTYAVSVDLLDEDGTHLDRANPLSVSVANVAPSIAISGAPSVNEGSPYTLNLGTVSDPGTDTVTSYIVHWGDGSMASYAAGGAVTHTYADGPNTYAVSVDLLDEDGTHLDRANPLSVSVANVAPTFSGQTNQSGNEGSLLSINLGSFADPGADSPWAVDVNWGDGSAHGTASKLTTGTLGSMNHTYADNGTYTVTVMVTDKDHAASSTTFTVGVANVAPTPAIGGAPATSPEGTAISMTGSASDPSSVDTAAGFSWAWSVTKNGVPYANATTQNFSFTPNDNATYVVTLKATDKDGGNASVSKTITVANVAPNSTSGFISIDPISGVVSANVAWFDPGTLDGQTVKFDYFRNGGVTPAATRIVTVGANVGTASDNLTQLEPGCHPHHGGDDHGQGRRKWHAQCRSRFNGQRVPGHLRGTDQEQRAEYRQVRQHRATEDHADKQLQPDRNDHRAEPVRHADQGVGHRAGGRRDHSGVHEQCGHRQPDASAGRWVYVQPHHQGAPAGCGLRDPNPGRGHHGSDHR